jgi:hypothetical protein
MRLFGWFRPGSRRGVDAPLRAWREAWAQAITSRDPGALFELEAGLKRDPPLADDLEIEDEMLEGLRRLLELDRELAAARLPRIETSHRAAGSDVCHFSAPVSMPDEAAQPTGRLLLTSTRAAFAGGGSPPPLPWHGVRDVLQSGRDLLLVRASDEAARFRCNSYGDVLCAAAIARHLVQRARGPRL